MTNCFPPVNVTFDLRSRFTFPRITLSSVPVIATGMIGNPERAARNATPGLPSINPPVRERVPSGVYAAIKAIDARSQAAQN